MQAWRVGDERTETYLRLLAEAELRRVGEQIRRVDAMAGIEARSREGMSLFGTTERAQWKVVRTARILVAAGVLDQECLDSVTSVLSAAIQVRSRLMLDWYRRQGVLHRTIFAPVVLQPPSPRPADPAMRVTPIGLTLEVASGRAPAALQPERTTCRMTSSGRWTTRGLATRRGSRPATARQLPGGASSSFHPCPRAAPGGWA